MTNWQTFQWSAEQRIIRHYGDPGEGSGIYVFSRKSDETGKICAYIGQAKSLRRRIAQHLLEYDHIALSLKNHGLFSNKKPFGWTLGWKSYPQDKLDEQERKMIAEYQELGYELYNITDGGQGRGKKNINPPAERKGYRKGKEGGYAKAYAEIAAMIDKYTTGLTSKGGATADRKTQELLNKLKGEVI